MRIWLLTIALAALAAIGGKPTPSATKQGSDTTGRTTVVINQQAPQEDDGHYRQPPSFLARLFSPENIPNIALVLVGIAGIITAVSSLRAINRQVTEMRRQVDLTFAQLRAMHEQITEMSEQTDVLEKSVAVAKQSADAVINGSRSWVMVDIEMVDIEWQKGAHILDNTSKDGKESTCIYVDYTCRNTGKSFAQITDKGYVFKRFDDPPIQPDFSETEWMFFTNEYLPPDTSAKPDELPGIICAGKRFSAGKCLFYGRVLYRDAYGEHETRFGYVVTPQGVLARLSASQYPEYNKHT